ncbi:MAG: penicillin-binding protein 2 [Candidatus Liptonbacteria bacterium]|nr:penicillin-binding protein 2 [Candidatus Liptonbacteria bacterium]
MFFKRRKKELNLEETLSDDWSKDKDTELVEVSLGGWPMIFAGLIVSLIAAVLVGRIVFVGLAQSTRYELRAEDNQNLASLLPAPRGIIYDRNGKIIADNRPVFSAYLKTDEFLRRADSQKQVLDSIGEILDVSPEEIWSSLESSDLEKNGGLLLLNPNLSQEEAVKLKSLNLPVVEIEDSFDRNYLDGEIFSSVLGYTGMVTISDLNDNSNLTIQDEIGKGGAELYYDDELRGTNGKTVQKRDARGRLFGDKEEIKPEIGKPLYLTIDADLQKYFYRRMKEQLLSLGRTKGVGLAMNPQNGEILAMLNFPVFDNNILSSGGRNSEKQAILTSRDKPLFNRATAGFYSPGSTIKPLVGVAALKEGVITPSKEIFSPGYIDIPNPYKPDEPTRYLDWQYQGYVNLASALAQSSDVYFYELGGGGPDSVGLGITRLRQWWQKFNLGNLTGIDFPGEAKGFLPSPDWKEKKDKRPWLLGDTYNVSIGQGDLLLTPLQLLSYISTIANGGEIYKPIINKNAEHKVISDISYLTPQFQEVRKGMRLVATSKRSMANTLGELPFAVEGKTGTAQVKNNQQLNAFFVGYVSAEALAEAGATPDKQIAVLVLVENSLEGSLNAVPIAKDVFNWYYENRIKKQ